MVYAVRRRCGKRLIFTAGSLGVRTGKVTSSLVFLWQDPKVFNFFNTEQLVTECLTLTLTAFHIRTFFLVTVTMKFTECQ